MINQTKKRLLKVFIKTQIQTGIIESNKNTTETWINTGSSGKGILSPTGIIGKPISIDTSNDKFNR